MVIQMSLSQRKTMYAGKDGIIVVKVLEIPTVKISILHD